MDKRLRFFVILLICLNIVWAVTLVGRSLSVSAPAPRSLPEKIGGTNLEASTKYTVYVGLNDKDAYTRLVSLDEAVRRLNAVAMKHVDGFTVRRAQGFWKDEKGVPTSEDTLVYDFVDAKEEQVVEIMNEMIEAMNQNSVLIEKVDSRRAFYGGAGEGK